jgi:subtilase family serine protease
LFKPLERKQIVLQDCEEAVHISALLSRELHNHKMEQSQEVVISMGNRTSAISLLIRAGIATMAALVLVSTAMAQTYVITGNTPGFIKKATDQGAVDPSTVISVTAWLKLHNENKLDTLAQSVSQKGSSSYRKWITQAQFNSTYAPKAQEVKAVQNFLQAHGLTLLTIAENNLYVKVQGTVGQIEKAFHVQIDNFSLNGNVYMANTADPSVNDNSGGLIAAVTGLDDFGFQPMAMRQANPDGTPIAPVPLTSSSNGAFFESQCFRGVQTVNFSGGGNTATYTGNRYGADITNTQPPHLAPCGYQPSEVQTAYNMTPLYKAGLDGTGETVVITDAFGSATIQDDAELFSEVYGLPDLNSTNFQVLRAPGAVNHPPTRRFTNPSGWADEITLDVEWVHAMAPGAKIVLVIGPNNGSDLDEAVNYAVVHHFGNTISNSWSGLEGFGNPAQFNRMNRILEAAAVQGIDVNFSSGDFGDDTVLVGFKTVGFPTSSPFATGVGGTSLALNPDNSIMFQTGWGLNFARIAEPETKAGSAPTVPPLRFGFQDGAGGGTSLTFAKPAFQSNLPGSMRMVPDISFLADPETGVEIIETVQTASGPQQTVFVIGGTSLACPMFSGLMGIAAQKAGHGLGQAAPLLYNLPAGAVTDVVPFSSPNNVTGVINGSTVESADFLAGPLNGTTQYYSALFQSSASTRWDVFTFGTDSSLATTPGWDNVTGVGTPNGWNFVNALVP